MIKFVALLFFALMGCPDPQPVEVDNPNIVCEAGQTQICSCSIAQMGERTCTANGFFGECMCGDDNNGNNGGSNTNLTDGGIVDPTEPEPIECTDADEDGF